MNPTAEQSRANLRTLRANIAAQLGVDPLNLTEDQRANYNRTLARGILDRPNSFTLETQQIAAAYLKQEAVPDRVIGATPSFTFENAIGQIAGDVKSTLLGLAALAVIAGLAFYILPGAIAKAKAA
jgi:hypothetical protein